MRNLKLLELLEQLARPTERTRLKASTERFKAAGLCADDIPWTEQQLAAIGAKFGVKPVRTEADPITGWKRGFWAAGISQQLGLFPDDDLRFDAKYGKRTIGGLDKTKFAITMQLIKRGVK